MNRQLDDAVLDAARECVLAYGVRRTTLTDVARRAGVSRMSIYRRWPDVRTLVADLMSREWHAVALDAMSSLGRGQPRSGMVAEMVAGAAALRAHPLLRRICEVDPETLLPYILDRRGASQDEMLAFIVEALREGQADGSVRSGEPERMARALLLTMQSFVLSSGIVTDGYSVAELDRELAELLDRYLRPD